MRGATCPRHGPRRRTSCRSSPGFDPVLSGRVTPGADRPRRSLWLRLRMPTIRGLAAVVLAFTAAAPLGAQSRELAVADTSPFRRLELPAANEVRTGSGRPGARYWQQR